MTREREDKPMNGFATAALAVTAGLAVSAYINHRKAHRAERETPPIGKFITVDGIRLHYIEKGEGPPLVLLHGNGTMAIDFLLSGLFDRAAKDHRVIAFDRPSFGHSPLPRDRSLDARAQAQLILRACARIHAKPALVLGHSWGASVAVEMGLLAPDDVTALVLVSGYFFPTDRMDVTLLSLPAIPVLGDVMRYTISPWIARLFWPGLVTAIFAPEPVPRKFKFYPREMSARPSQLRAAALETGMMVPGAAQMQGDYRHLPMPVMILAGGRDPIVSAERQSARLHREIPGSTYRLLPEAGHMLHQTATHHVMRAIGDAQQAATKHAPAIKAKPQAASAYSI